MLIEVSTEANFHTVSDTLSPPKLGVGSRWLRSSVILLNDSARAARPPALVNVWISEDLQLF